MTDAKKELWSKGVHRQAALTLLSNCSSFFASIMPAGRICDNGTNGAEKMILVSCQVRISLVLVIGGL